MNNLFGSLKRDLPSSLVVFLVAIPLCLGVALASGAPAFSGLLAGVIGGLVVGVISGSHLGVSGPAAGLTAIVLGSVASLGSFQLFLMAVLLAGVIQVLMGLIKGGAIAYFFPSAVIKGMLAGIGIFIALTQVPHAFGSVPDTAVGGVFAQLPNLFKTLHPGALLIAGTCMLLLLLWERPFVRRNNVLSLMPGPLLAVIAGILLAGFFRSVPELALGGGHFVVMPDLAGTSFRALFSGPDWAGVMNPQVWLTALTLALVASMETLLSVEAVDKLDPWERPTPKNRELVAQGVGNMLAGLVGALPITQVIVRSSVNVQSGGTTKLAAILHGLWILAAVLLFQGLLGMIPLAALAAILVQVGYKLAKPAIFKQMWDGGWMRFVPFIATVLGVVFLDLLKGVGIGMAIGLFLILRNNYKVPFHLLERTVVPGGPVRIRLGEDTSFLNKASIRKAISEMPLGTHIIIDVSRTVALDPDIRELLEEEAERAKNKGSRVEIAGLREHRRTRVAARLSEKHVHETFRVVMNGKTTTPLA